MDLAPARTAVVTAPTWGGNLEILHWNLAADRWIRPVEDYAGCVLLLETSEEMPPAEEVFRMLRNAGERGLLEQFPAILVGTAKAAAFGHVRPPEERARYRDDQRAAVLRRSRTTTPTRWWSSASTSGTPIRSGCCRTAAGSPSTVRRGGSSRTTEPGAGKAMIRSVMPLRAYSPGSDVRMKQRRSTVASAADAAAKLSIPADIAASSRQFDARTSSTVAASWRSRISSRS